MNNKFEVLDLVEIKHWDDIASRPNYIGDIDPAITQLEEIISPYDIQDEEIRCGIKSCHQPHHMGYVVRTRAGEETNIGNYCGRKHFGSDFGLLKNKSEGERRLQRYRRQLNEIIYNSDDIFGRVNWLRNRGGDWLNKAQRELRGKYPKHVVDELKRRAERDDPTLTVGRKRTEDELFLAKIESLNREEDELLYTEDIVGSLKGLEIFNRNVRDVLIVEVERKMRDLLEIDPDTSVHRLKSWYDWSRSIDDLFAETELLIEEGRRFFSPENFDLLHAHVMRGIDTAKYEWDFESGICTVREKRNRNAG